MSENKKSASKKAMDSILTDNRYLFYVLLVILFLTIGFVWYNIFDIFRNSNYLEDQTYKLHEIMSYDVNPNNISSNYIWWIELEWSDSILNMFLINDNIKTIYEWYSTIYNDIHSSYNSFLKYIYFPSLNIWQDPITEQIDLNFIWKRFLVKNPYSNINLINKWSLFFQNVWSNVPDNIVETIDVSDIGSFGWLWFNAFSFNIDVSYRAESRQSFLMLINKLSLTSNRNNLSLINEFTYHLRKAIRSDEMFVEKFEDIKKLYNWNYWNNLINIKYLDSEDQENEITIEKRWNNFFLRWKYIPDEEFENYLDPNQYDWLYYKIWLMKDYIKIEDDIEKIIQNMIVNTEDKTDENKILWKYLYDWIFNLWENILITPDILNSTICSLTNCIDWELNNKSLFAFREKFRSIPYLAYAVWYPSNRQGFDENNINDLRKFYGNLPPILFIKNFVFNKIEWWIGNWYIWNIWISIVWENIENEEVVRLKQQLTRACFSPDNKVNFSDHQSILKYIAEKIRVMSWNINDADKSEKLKDLLELEEILKTKSLWWSNFDSSIASIEIYRMIKENWLCDIY